MPVEQIQEPLPEPITAPEANIPQSPITAPAADILPEPITTPAADILPEPVATPATIPQSPITTSATIRRPKKIRIPKAKIPSKKVTTLAKVQSKKSTSTEITNLPSPITPAAAAATVQSSQVLALEKRAHEAGQAKMEQMSNAAAAFKKQSRAIREEVDEMVGSQLMHLANDMETLASRQYPRQQMSNDVRQAFTKAVQAIQEVYINDVPEVQNALNVQTDMVAHTLDALQVASLDAVEKELRKSEWRKWIGRVVVLVSIGLAYVLYTTMPMDDMSFTIPWRNM